MALLDVTAQIGGSLARGGWLLVLCGLAGGCDDLTVRTFAGSIITLTIQSTQASNPGEHLELWARDANNGIVRVPGIVDAAAGKASYGMQIRLAVDPADPCMIVTDPKSPTYGELLTSPNAYRSNTNFGGVVQTPAQQAQQVINHIAQINASSLGGDQDSSLLALVAATEVVPPTVAADAAAADRAAACQAYWKSDPLAYTGNPLQTTAPFHGVLYGVLTYSTTTPPITFDGARIDSPTALPGIGELWMTIETVPAAMVDPLNRGVVFIDGTPTLGGDRVVHFDLTGPAAIGTAAVYEHLDDDSFEL